jgi:hypothetical protein
MIMPLLMVIQLLKNAREAALVAASRILTIWE